MIRYNRLVMLLFVLSSFTLAFTGFNVSVAKAEDTPQIFSQVVTSIPNFSLNPDLTNLTDNQQITPEFAPFLAVTMVEVIIQQNFSKIAFQGFSPFFE